MNKFHMLVVAVIFVLCMAMPNVSLAAVADGTYSVEYQVNKPGTTSASIANDYFAKPATLTVKDGQMTMQLTIKSSSWVTEFNPPAGARVISENAATNERVVQFPVEQVDVVTIPMKIDIDDIDYHHAYSVDFVFDSANLPAASAPQKEEASQTTPVTEQQQAPQSKPQQQVQQQQQAQQQAAEKPVEGAEAAAPTATSTPQQPADAQSTEQAPTATQQVTISNNEQTKTTQEQNPATSDNAPLFYVILLMLAAIVFMRTTKRKTI